MAPEKKRPPSTVGTRPTPGARPFLKRVGGRVSTMNGRQQATSLDVVEMVGLANSPCPPRAGNCGLMRASRAFAFLPKAPPQPGLFAARG